MASGFVQTNLVSDVAGMAANTDAHLHNPWGIAADSTSPFWVANNNDGTSTIYTAQGTSTPPVVTIPTNTTTTPPTLGSPSGIVANTFATGFVDKGSAFGYSGSFLFATEDGNIDVFSGATTATVAVNNPSAGYKGLTLATDAAGDHLLYAANMVQNRIDVFDDKFQLVQGASGGNAKASPITLTGAFTDPSLPAGYAPFNIQAIGNKLYVEYAKFDPNTTEGAPGTGQGFVDVYSPDGVLQTPQHLISGGALNAPWGITMAPANFGALSNDLLVGNFGDGKINAFDPNTGAFVAPLMLQNGQPFQEDNLWGLQFGNGNNAPTSTLFFTAGINDQKDGLFGSLQAQADTTTTPPTSTTPTTSTPTPTPTPTPVSTPPATTATSTPATTGTATASVAPQVPLVDLTPLIRRLDAIVAAALRQLALENHHAAPAHHHATPHHAPASTSHHSA